MTRFIVLVIGLFWLCEPVALLWPSATALCERHGVDCSCPEVCALSPRAIPEDAMCHRSDGEEPPRPDTTGARKEADCSIKASCSDEEKGLQAAFSRVYLPSERFRWERPCLFQEKLEARLFPGIPDYAARISHPPRLS